MNVASILTLRSYLPCLIMVGKDGFCSFHTAIEGLGRQLRLEVKPRVDRFQISWLSGILLTILRLRYRYGRPPFELSDA